MEVDHYNILCLPSGEEGAILTEKEIDKVYREKARDLHPDKRKDDPDAHENFIKLKYSYEILVDDKARKLFDDLLHAKCEQQRRFTQQDSKRRKMMSDLEDREHASFSPDPTVTAKEEEDRTARKLKEEIARIRAMHTNKGSSTGMGTCSGLNQAKTRVRATVELDKEKVLKVSWDIVGEGYTVDKLNQLFSRFGEVEDIVIRSSKKRGSALVVMSTKEAAAAATGSALLVMPLKPAPQKTQESLQAFEEFVFCKLKNVLRQSAGVDSFVFFKDS